jgi:hypothetical protein
MKTVFELNLCRALAHTLVLENHLPGIAPDYFRNDMGTSYSPPDPAQVSRDTILAEMEAMRGTGSFAHVGALPDLISEMSPKYTDISLENTRNYLNGTAGHPGMLDLYTNAIVPAMSQMQTTQRTADLRDVASLGPQALAAIRAYNPEVTSKLDLLNNQADQELSLNGALDPFTKAMLAQDIRSGQAARGMGTGYADAAAESYYQDAGRQQRRAQARDFATRTATLTNGIYGDPFTMVLNRSNPSATMAAFAQGAAGSDNATSAVTNGFSFNNPMISQVYGAQNQANAYHAQAQSDLMGGLIKFGGGILAGGAAGFMACWSAREIFGEANPRWKQFRHWMLHRAPAKFRRWYLLHGAHWAERIREMQPETRSAIRRWMVSKINLQPVEAL